MKQRIEVPLEGDITRVVLDADFTNCDEIVVTAKGGVLTIEKQVFATTILPGYGQGPNPGRSRNSQK